MAATNIFFRATSDAAVIYWDLPADAASGVLYTIFQDGTPVGSTMKTHFTLAPLQPNSAYTVAVCAAGQPLAQITVATAARRRRLDVTAAPYRAVGDGKTMNTTALQRAFDNCGAGEEVYFPAGVYLTGIRQTAFSFESESEGVAPEEPVTPVEIHGFAAPGHEVRRVLLKDCTLPNAPLAVTCCLDFCIKGTGLPSDA